MSEPPRAAPSRHSNPFATCWTQPGALPFTFGGERDGVGAIGSIVERLFDRGRGQVVGRHGSGKTTLLRALQERIEQDGGEVRRHTIDAHAMARIFGAIPRDATHLVDGIERARRRDRRRLLAEIKRSGGRCLLATHHRWTVWPEPLPVLSRLRPTAQTALLLFRHLTQQAETPLEQKDLLHSFRRQRGDLRRVWFDLYHLHERRTRPARTRGVRVTYCTS